MKSLSVTIQMKATEQYFPVILFIMLYKVFMAFKSEDEILKCTILPSSEHNFLWYCLPCCKRGF